MPPHPEMNRKGAAQLLILIVLLLACVGPRPAAAQTAASPGTRIILLGTGTPNPDPQRSGPATAILVHDAVYLVDCGPGVVRRAAAAGIGMKKLTHLFVTHLHSDHTAGYPDLILTPWVIERDKPLEVFGPRGIADMTRHILAAYREDIDVRLHGLQPSNPEGYRVNAHEIMPGIIYRDANVVVKAFRVPHGTWKEAYGFRFETPGRTVVISGDTTPSPAVVENARGADVLIHEVYSQAGFARRPPDWQRYHAHFHTSSVELARMAGEARPRLLLLTHVMLWGASEEQLLEEIRRTYDGHVVVGKDLQVY